MTGARTGPREVAARVLARVFDGTTASPRRGPSLGQRAFASAALEAELQREVRLEARDRALATELVYGSLRTSPWLLQQIERFAGAWVQQQCFGGGSRHAHTVAGRLQHARHEDHAGMRAVASHSTRELEAVEGTGHGDIADDRANLSALGHRERILAVRGDDHVEARLAEHVR